MEFNKTLFQKLEYLENLHNKNTTKKIKQEKEIKKFSFIDLTRKEYKLIKQFNEKFLTKTKNKQKNPNSTNSTNRKNDFLCNKNLENLTIKLKIFHFYLNFSLGILLLKYSDMITLVKRGSFYYFTFSLFSFFYLNKFYLRFKNSQMFFEIAEIKKKDPNDLLDKVKLKVNKSVKYNEVLNGSLDKYWKEPMAWH